MFDNPQVSSRVENKGVEGKEECENEEIKYLSISLSLLLFRSILSPIHLILRFYLWLEGSASEEGEWKCREFAVFRYFLSPFTNNSLIQYLFIHFITMLTETCAPPEGHVGVWEKERKKSQNLNLNENLFHFHTMIPLSPL